MHFGSCAISHDYQSKRYENHVRLHSSQNASYIYQSIFHQQDKPGSNRWLTDKWRNRRKTKSNIEPCNGGCGPVHKPFAYHAGAPRSFPDGDNADYKQLYKQPIKAALMFASTVVPSGHSWTTKASCQDDWFTSQSPTPMVAHCKLTSSPKITDVNWCVEVLGKTSRTIPPLSTQQWWVPGATKIVNGISFANALNCPPEEMGPYKREFQYQGCKL